MKKKTTKKEKQFDLSLLWLINQLNQQTSMTDFFFSFWIFLFLFFGPPSLSRLIFLFLFFVASVNLWFSCWDQRPYWAAALWERFQLPIENPGWRGALVFWFVNKILKHKIATNLPTNYIYIYIIPLLKRTFNLNEYRIVCGLRYRRLKNLNICWLFPI